jgi:hypothetical protein
VHLVVTAWSESKTPIRCGVTGWPKSERFSAAAGPGSYRAVVQLPRSVSGDSSARKNLLEPRDRRDT